MKKNPLFLVISLSLLTWWKLSLVPIRGDGFVYFIDKYNQAYLNNFLRNLTSFDWSAIILGEIISTLFKTNIVLYGWLQVIFLLLTVALFYWCVFVLTKRSLVSFTASLILGTSYYGNWDMYAGGIYPWFLERIPLMVFLIPSFTFLHIFLQKQKIKYYIYSILLFFVGVGISHWGVIFVGLYMIYPVLWSFFNDKSKIKNYIIFSSLYLFIVLFFVIAQKLVGSNVGPTWGIVEFASSPLTHHYVRDMVSQLVYWTTYLPFIKNVFAGFVQSPITTFVIAEASLRFTPIVIAGYLFAFIFTYIKLPKFRVLLLTVVFSLFSILFINAYLGQYHIPTQPGSNRYLYLPTYLLAIYWSLFLWSAFWINKTKRYYIGHLILLIFFIVNYWLVSENFKWNMETYTKTRVVWKVTESAAAFVPENSFIILPNKETGFYEAQFLSDQFKHKSLTFLSDVDSWEEKVKNSPNVYKIEYDAICKCGKTIKWEKTKK